MPRKPKTKVLDKFTDLLPPEKIEPSTRYLSFKPKNDEQRVLVDKIRGSNEIIFISGPAGCGKTLVSVACALDALNKNQIKKIIITRPAVETEEKLGFLPGNLNEKLDPYLRPLYDMFKKFITPQDLDLYMRNDIIEICPIAYLRGRTFDSCFLVCDESSNLTDKQMLMLLTRIGENSKFLINGDPDQSDLPNWKQGALEDYMERLGHIKNICTHYFSEFSIVRNPLIQQIIEATNDDDFSIEKDY